MSLFIQPHHPYKMQCMLRVNLKGKQIMDFQGTPGQTGPRISDRCPQVNFVSVMFVNERVPLSRHLALFHHVMVDDALHLTIHLSASLKASSLLAS